MAGGQRSELPRVDSQGTIVMDTPCVSCGYNLRGLSVEGRCPECSAVVSRTLDPRRLRFSDPRWLTRLRVGAGFLAVSTNVSMFLVALYWGTDTTTDFLSWCYRFEPADMDVPIDVIWAKVVFMAFVIGIWLLASREPCEPRRPRRRWPRRACRAGGAATLVVFSLAGVASHYFAGFYFWFWLAAVLVFVGWVAIICLYIAQLAIRVPNKGLVRFSHVVLLCLVLMGGATAMAGAHGALGPAGSHLSSAVQSWMPPRAATGNADLLWLPYRRVLGLAASVCAVLGHALALACTRVLLVASAEAKRNAQDKLTPR